MRISATAFIVNNLLVFLKDLLTFGLSSTNHSTSLDSLLVYLHLEMSVFGLTAAPATCGQFIVAKPEVMKMHEKWGCKNGREMTNMI